MCTAELDEELRIPWIELDRLLQGAHGRAVSPRLLLGPGQLEPREGGVRRTQGQGFLVVTDGFVEASEVGEDVPEEPVHDVAVAPQLQCAKSGLVGLVVPLAPVQHDGASPVRPLVPRRQANGVRRVRQRRFGVPTGEGDRALYSDVHVVWGQRHGAAQETTGLRVAIIATRQVAARVQLHIGGKERVEEAVLRPTLDEGAPQLDARGVLTELGRYQQQVPRVLSRLHPRVVSGSNQPVRLLALSQAPPGGGDEQRRLKGLVPLCLQRVKVRERLAVAPEARKDERSIRSDLVREGRVGRARASTRDRTVPGPLPGDRAGSLAAHGSVRPRRRAGEARCEAPHPRPGLRPAAPPSRARRPRGAWPSPLVIPGCEPPVRPGGSRPSFRGPAKHEARRRRGAPDAARWRDGSHRRFVSPRLARHATAPRAAPRSPPAAAPRTRGRCGALPGRARGGRGSRRHPTSRAGERQQRVSALCRLALRHAFSRRPTRRAPMARPSAKARRSCARSAASA